jgi:hypothetical protein
LKTTQDLKRYENLVKDHSLRNNNMTKFWQRNKQQISNCKFGRTEIVGQQTGYGSIRITLNKLALQVL